MSYNKKYLHAILHVCVCVYIYMCVCVCVCVCVPRTCGMHYSIYSIPFKDVTLHTYKYTGVCVKCTHICS